MTDHTIPKQTRRDFIKNSARAVSTGVALTTLPVSGSAWVDARDVIKVAVVGCGGRGTGAAAQALEADPGVRLVALADVFEDRLEKKL